MQTANTAVKLRQNWKMVYNTSCKTYYSTIICLIAANKENELQKEIIMQEMIENLCRYIPILVYIRSAVTWGKYNQNEYSWRDYKQFIHFSIFFSICSPSTLLNLQVWQSVWLNWYYLSPGGSPGHWWGTVPLIISRWSSRDWYHEQSLPASYHYYGPSTWISSQMCGVGSLENCIIVQHKI